MQEWRFKAEAYLLKHLARVPASLGPHGSSFRMLRTGGAAGSAGLLDIMRAACGPASQLRAFNPFLSGASCDRLQQGIRTWLQLCVLEDRLGRLAALAAAGNEYTTQLVQVRAVHAGVFEVLVRMKPKSTQELWLAGLHA